MIVARTVSAPFADGGDSSLTVATMRAPTAFAMRAGVFDKSSLGQSDNRPLGPSVTKTVGHNQVRSGASEKAGIDVMAASGSLDSRTIAQSGPSRQRSGRSPD